MNPGDASEQTIFDAARQMPDAQARAAYLDAACAGNPSLRERVERLIQAGQRADEFLAANPLELGGTGQQTISVPPLSEGPGTVIGNYKLLEKLGEGGFGVVYMAEQKQPIKRRVALKIIKAGMDTREVVARFEAERQALALMDHPNIAKVFDAGSTERPLTCPSDTLSPSGPSGREGPGEGDGYPRPSDGRGAGAEGLSAGRPYFVMELVRGVRITDYCDEKKLSTRERLDLFTQVCQSVQHAHQKGIIHRDLKPSNILVTINDGVAVPKIIDFGIAKATQLELTEKTVFTRFHQFLGTPAYMSPEQTEITSVDIDTRSDIYSLGVLLYELLTGKTPFDTHELLKAGLDEMRRVIREKEPERPSTRLTRELARQRVSAQSAIGNRQSAIDHDLDWIVMKCLEKDRARRYETANGLATDIQRHLNNEPVVACPPSNLYKFQKLVRRNKFAFAAGAGIAASLVIGLAIALWQSIEKTRAYNRAVVAERDAKTEAIASKQIAQFLENMLEGVGPEVAKGRDATILKEILNKTGERIGTELAGQPKTEAYLRERLGKVYAALGDYPAAELMQRRVLDLRRQLYPGGHRDLVGALDNLALTCMLRGRLPEAERLSREALAMGEKFPGPRPGDRAAWLTSLATILKHQNKFAEAEEKYREALTLDRKVFGNEHREVAVALNNLAGVLYNLDKFDQAEPLLHESIDMCKKLFGSDSPIAAAALTTLTTLLSHQRRLAEAEVVGNEAVAMQKAMHGNEHPYVANALGNLAGVYRRQRKLAEAESLQLEALAIRRKKLGPAHPVLARSLHDLGIVLNSRGKLIKAEAILREALTMANKFPGNDYVDPTKVLAELNEVLTAQGKPTEANAPADTTPAAPTDKK
jgi:serine/threonine protein kinase